MDKFRKPIYIVDDDRSFGRSFKRLLNSRGIAANHFDSAQAFLDSIPSGQKGIAVVDIYMPECDGFSLKEKMRDMGYTMPVIFITGHAEADTRDMAMQWGAVGFLQKPFDVRSLLDLLEEIEQQGDE